MKSFISDPNERTRFIRFSIVGIIGTVVDFGVFNLLARILLLNPIAASVFSFSIAVVNNYFLNRNWTYPDSRSKSFRRQLTEFSVISIIGLGIRTPVFILLENLLPELFASLSLPPHPVFDPVFIGHNTALAIAILIVLFWNYFVNRYWTFSDVD